MPMPVLPLVGSMSVSPGLDAAVFLRLFDHAPSDAVLDRSARIQELALGEQSRSRSCFPTRLRRTSGVFPTAWRMLSRIGAMARGHPERSRFRRREPAARNPAARAEARGSPRAAKLPGCALPHELRPRSRTMHVSARCRSLPTSGSLCSSPPLPAALPTSARQVDHVRASRGAGGLEAPVIVPADEELRASLFDPLRGARGPLGAWSAGADGRERLCVRRDLSAGSGAARGRCSPGTA